MRQVYRTSYAGSWYPDDPGVLRELLQGLFRESETRTGRWLRGGARGFLAPHAGLMYSGSVAAAVFRHMARRQPRVVVILGFLHPRRHAGIALPAPACYSTPLGEVEVDHPTIDALTRTALFQRVEAAQYSDHSTEIQLPLLQWTCPGVKVVIAYVGELTAGERLRAAGALAALPADTVFLASSDLTHYGRSFGYEPFSPDAHVTENLRRLDMETLDAASSLDPALLLASLHKTRSTVCGHAPIALLLETMRQSSGGEIYQQMLDYRNSADITGDTESSVSYGAAAYFPAESFALEPEEAESVLDSAEHALTEYARRGVRCCDEPESPDAGNHPIPGVFITIRRDGHPQGCLGRLHTDVPLRAIVPELTLSAALDDSRFGALPRSDYDDVSVELSLLTPLKQICDPRNLRPGIHGAVLEAGGATGLLLPQVGRREGWSRDRFLLALSQKARLGEAGWKLPGAKLSVFQAFCYERTPHHDKRNYAI